MSTFLRHEDNITDVGCFHRQNSWTSSGEVEKFGGGKSRGRTEGVFNWEIWDYL